MVNLVNLAEQAASIIGKDKNTTVDVDADYSNRVQLITGAGSMNGIAFDNAVINIYNDKVTLDLYNAAESIYTDTTSEVTVESVCNLVKKAVY